MAGKGQFGGRFGRIWARLHKRRGAATHVEYGLLIGLLAVVLLGTLAALGVNLAEVFGTADRRLAVGTGTLAGAAVTAGPADGLSVPLSVTLSLIPPDGNGASVRLTTEDGSAHAPADYGALDTRIDFAPGETQKSLVLLATPAAYGTQRALVLHLSQPQNAEILTGSVTVDLPSGQPAPKVRFAETGTVTVPEGGAAVPVEVVLSGTSASDTVLSWHVEPGSAGADDFAPGLTDPQPLTVPAGATQATLSLQAAADPDREADEAATLVLDAAGSGLTVDNPFSRAILVPANGDLPQMNLALVPQAALPEGAPVTVQAVISGTNYEDATATATLVPGTADAGDVHFVEGGGATLPVTIPAGSQQAELALDIVADGVQEPDETFTLQLSDPSGARLGPDAAAQMTIAANGATPVASLALQGPDRIAEGGAVTHVAVSLTNPTSIPLHLPLSVSGTGGFALADDLALSVGGTALDAGDPRVTVPAGQSGVTLDIAAVDDSVFEPSQTVTLALAAPQDGTATVAGDPVALTLDDNDAQPTVTVADLSLDEGASGNIAVSLSAASGVDTVVAVQWQDGAGNPAAPAGLSAGGDATQIVIPAGATGAVLAVTAAAQEGTHQGDSSLQLALLSAEGATLGAARIAHIAIRDTDPLPEVSLSAGGASLNEGGSVQLTLALSRRSTASVRVPLVFSGTAGTGDFQLTLGGAPLDLGNPVVTVAAGQSGATLQLQALADGIFEGDETLQIGFGAVENASAGSGASLTLHDGDSAPTVGFAPESVSTAIAENAGSIGFIVRLSGRSSQPVSVPFALSGTATQGTDYTVSATPLVIPAGATEAAITVTAVQDSIFEGGETAIVTLGDPANGSAVLTATAADRSRTATVTDDDAAPVVSFDTETPSGAVAEAFGTISFTVALSNASSSDVTVPFVLSGTAAQGTDYTVTASPLTIPAGSTRATIYLGALSDTIYEGDETAVLTLDPPTGATLTATAADRSRTATIADDDPPPVVSFASSSPDSNLLENAGYTGFTVTLDRASSQPVSVPFALTGTAISGTDYTPSASPLTIPAGTTAAVIGLTGIDDATFEGSETVIVTLGNPTGGTLVATAADRTRTATLLDDDPAPTVAFDTPGDSAIPEAGGTVSFKVKLSNPTTAAVSIPFSLAGTASSADDYTVTASPLSIAAGDNSATITVTAKADSIYEGNETAVLTLGTPSGGGATLTGLTTARTRTATITDAQSAPVVGFSTATPNAAIAEAAGSVTFRVSMTPAAAVDVFVPFAPTGTAQSGDYTVTASPVRIPAGQTSADIVVTAVQDSVYEGNETAILTLGTPSGSGATLTATAADRSRTATVTDDDAMPVVAFDTATGSGNVAEAAGQISFTVKLSNASSSDISVPFKLTGTASTADYSVTASPLTIAAGNLSATVTVTAVQDDIYEGNETVIVTLDTPTGATLTGTTLNLSRTATIQDDDSAPTVRFDSAFDNLTVTESTSASVMATYRVRLSNPSATSITVPLKTGGTATPGSDYSVPASVTFVPGVTSMDVTQQVYSDSTTYEGTETATLTLDVPTPAGSATLSATAAETVRVTTVLDAQTMPTVAFSTASGTLPENSSSGWIFNVQLSGRTQAAVTVPIALSGTATPDTDYTVSFTAGKITFDPGTTTVYVTVTPKTDNVYEPSETAIMTLGTPTSGNAAVTSVAADTTRMLTITDVGGAPTVSTADVSVNEGAAGSVAFTLSRTSTADTVATLQWRDGNGTAWTPPSTYLTAGGSTTSVTIPAGASSASVPFTSFRDTSYYGNRALRLAVTAVSGGSVGSPAVSTITLVEQDAAPVVTLTSSFSSFAENGGAKALKVTLNRASSAAITVPVTYGGTATVNGSTDSDVSAPTSVTVPANSTSADLTLTPANDAIFEPTETVAVTLGTPTPAGGATLGSTKSAILNLTDATPYPALAIVAPNPSTVNEGSGLDYTVTMTGRSSMNVTVNWAIGFSGATAADFSGSTSGTLTFAPSTSSSQSQTVTVTALADSIMENAEGFTVGLSGASNATVPTPSAAGTITASNTYYASCAAIKTNTGATTSGEYTVDYDGVGSEAQHTVYCDMSQSPAWTVARASERTSGFLSLFKGNEVGVFIQHGGSITRSVLTQMAGYTGEAITLSGTSFNFRHGVVSGSANGLALNGTSYTFTNCDNNANSFVGFATGSIGGNNSGTAGGMVEFFRPMFTGSSGLSMGSQYFSPGMNLGFGGCGLYLENGAFDAAYGASYTGSAFGLR